MRHHNLLETKRTVTHVLNDAQGTLPAADFLHRVVGQGYDQGEVVAALREMLEAGEIRFDPDMRICLTKEMA